MGYTQHEPVSEKKMLRRRYDGHRTICQVLREIYGLAGDAETGAQIKLKCRIAMAMAKSMHDRLKKYKEQTAK